MLMLTILLHGCSNNQKTTKSKNLSTSITNNEDPILSLSINEIDLGNINKKENEFISTSFEFINEGEKPLVITKADISCGCIKVDYTKNPIMKGKMGKINIRLDTRKLMGYFHKNIRILYNTENEYEELSIKGRINENL